MPGVPVSARSPHATPGLPALGDVVRVDGRASVQFAGERALVLRVLKVDTRSTYYGWCWLIGYVLDQRGEAVERREAFVQIAGLRRARESPPTRARPVQLRPAREPRSRPNARPAERPPTTRARDQGRIHRAWTYPQPGSLV